MLKTRYQFIKRLYPNYVLVFIEKKQKYHLVEEQMRFLKIFKKKNMINTLEYYHINYLVIDNLSIVKKKEFSDNRYLELLKKAIIIELMNRFEMKKKEKRI